jgi:hypothetical protein
MGRASQIERVIAKGQLIALHFQQADVAASQTNAALTVAEVRDTAATADDQNAVDAYVIPWDFEIIGVSARSSAARSAGTLTVEPLVNATASGMTAALDATTTQSTRTIQNRGADTGVAGDRVACRITTDGTWAPVTADIVVTVWVLVHIEGV